ncbi:hypothetical protein KB206_02695 [Microvirga sp. STS02]|uniref:hypothetical protein n=1 Tax=Hymenobacter negativus TaxID=2795026 RepID=UPI0018DC506B|nr:MULTISPECIES: hypothetical protein [Bacteria]MBH8567774.1 hypothetical protein [Hymenobacter negativus]MBR7207508.1 hypothetical protein [Microvirga sp. STS02]
MKKRFALLSIIVLCTSAVIGSKQKFPTEYSGGLPRIIFVDLILKNKNIYTYSEFTHAGYSVQDSGTYRLKDTTIIFHSIRTIHKMQKRRKRMTNGKYSLVTDSINYRKLFVNQKCSFHADTIVVWQRNVLVNKEFSFSLVNYHK